MQQKQKALIISALSVLLIVSAFFIYYSLNNQETENIINENEKQIALEEAAKQEKMRQENTESENAPTPLTITSQDLPDSAQIVEDVKSRLLQDFERYNSFVPENTPEDPENKKINPQEAVSVFPIYNPALNQPTPTDQQESKLTDEEMFAIMYTQSQLDVFADMQDLLILGGDIPENERLVFDNETKIRNFIIRGMDIGCKQEYIKKEFCDNFKKVGAEPFFAMKKEEEKSLRETGKLPGKIASLNNSREFADRKTLSEILAHTPQAQNELPEESASCPNPAMPGGNISFGGIIDSVKNLFGVNSAQATVNEYGNCSYSGEHIHAYEAGPACGKEVGGFNPAAPTLPTSFTFCCHCSVSKYCIPVGCLNAICGDEQQALWDGVTGACGCGGIEA